jgi:hypothetical protein
VKLFWKERRRHIDFKSHFEEMKDTPVYYDYSHGAPMELQLQYVTLRPSLAFAGIE